MKDWKFTRMMRYSGLQFTEGQMLKIVEGLGNKGQWNHAVSVVEWVYNSKEQKNFKSRYDHSSLEHNFFFQLHLFVCLDANLGLYTQSY